MRQLSNSFKNRDLSRIQTYEMETIALAQRMVRTLLKHNMYNKERILELYDRLVDFPLKYAGSGHRLEVRAINPHAKFRG